MIWGKNKVSCAEQIDYFMYYEKFRVETEIIFLIGARGRSWGIGCVPGVISGPSATACKRYQERGGDEIHDKGKVFPWECPNP